MILKLNIQEERPGLEGLAAKKMDIVCTGVSSFVFEIPNGSCEYLKLQRSALSLCHSCTRKRRMVTQKGNAFRVRLGDCCETETFCVTVPTSKHFLLWKGKTTLVIKRRTLAVSVNLIA